MKFNFFKIAPTALLLAIALPGFSTEIKSEAEADKIIGKVRDRADGNDYYSEASLITIENDGNERTRKLIYLQKDSEESENFIIYFTEPKDVEKVAFKIANYAEITGKEDDQWMYLPAFRKTRRISASDKRGSFMGSAFSYIDLDKPRVGDYSQKLVGEELAMGRDCHVIERIPVSDAVINKTGYHRTVVWVDKERFMVLRQTYYDAKNVLFKEMNVKKLEEVDGVWSVMDSEMVNRVNEKSSRLLFTYLKYDVGLEESLFAEKTLRIGVNARTLPQALSRRGF